MTRDQAKEFRTSLNNVLKTLEEKYQMKFSVGNIRFNENSVITKIEGLSNSTSKQEIKLDIYKKSFDLYCKLFDLKPEDLGKVNSKGFKLVGLDMAKRKYPIIMEKDGKQYKAEKFVI
jgi:methyltransferase-like protein